MLSVKHDCVARPIRTSVAPLQSCNTSMWDDLLVLDFLMGEIAVLRIWQKISATTRINSNYHGYIACWH